MFVRMHVPLMLIGRGSDLLAERDRPRASSQCVYACVRTIVVSSCGIAPVWWPVNACGRACVVCVKN